jgi:hypothetical protein
MWRHRDTRGLDQCFNGVAGGFERGSTCAESDGQVIRLQRRKFLPGGFQDEFLFRRPWRKELE